MCRVLSMQVYIFLCAVHAFYVHLPLKRQAAVETMLYSISWIDSHALQTERKP
jgi:hypothetical protein